jgi:hypothetical protein
MSAQRCQNLCRIWAMGSRNRLYAGSLPETHATSMEGQRFSKDIAAGELGKTNGRAVGLTMQAHVSNLVFACLQQDYIAGQRAENKLLDKTLTGSARYCYR